MEKLQESLREIAKVASIATSQPTVCPIPGVLLIKGEVSEDQLSALYQPMVGFVVQGRKSISIGGQVVIVEAPSYFVVPTELPATARVQSGADGLPYISVGLNLNENAVVNLLEDLPPAPIVDRGTNRFSACLASEEFVDAWLRMLRLMERPEDIPALAPVYEREILYRVLTGPEGWRIRSLCFTHGHSSSVRLAAQWIRENYKSSFDTNQVCEKYKLSNRTFHRQFKLLTGLSPIQYQKQLRLLEARKLLAYSRYTVADAAVHVGYDSPSQFTREYARFFGQPPARDALRLKRLELDLEPA